MFDTNVPSAGRINRQF